MLALSAACNNGFQRINAETCPLCAGKESDSHICWTWIGTLKESLLWSAGLCLGSTKDTKGITHNTTLKIFEFVSPATRILGGSFAWRQAMRFRFVS